MTTHDATSYDKAVAYLFHSWKHMSISWPERNKLHHAIDNMHLTLFIHDN